jgi:hypothetical protein
VVLLRAELVDGRAEQAPLHTRLDLQARVGEDELHEPGEVGAVVLEAAVGLRERAARAVVLDEEAQLTEHALAVLGHRLAVDAPERRVLDHLARLTPRLAPRAEEQIGDGVDVDARLVSLLRRVRRGGGASRGRALAGGGPLRVDVLADGGVGHGCTSRRRRTEKITFDRRRVTTDLQTGCT